MNLSPKAVMPKPKPTWTQKLQCSKPAVIKTLDKAFADMPEGSRMMIASPEIIDRYVRNLTPGQFITPKELRADLADSHKAEHTCPVTTGIFLRVVAEAAWEQHLAGVPMKDITPFWRVIEPESPLAGKLACGLEFIRTQRSSEKAASKVKAHQSK
jgi:hypothetical protein